MAARLGEATTKIHLHLYTRDLEFIDANFCRQGIRVVGRSEAIRAIVHSYVKHLEKKTNAKPVPFDPTIAELVE
jgi:hypothetical protein